VTEFGEFQILLIEDNAADAKLFEHALEKSGSRARIYWVASAEEGLEFLRREGRFAGVSGPQLVVTDLNMPSMDGFEFLQRARNNPALAALPIVVFSGSRAPRDVLRCYRLGANSFITKPMSLENSVAIIETLVRYWLDIVQLPDPGLLD
jgi:chemotaxis family two-component system response regulator Rcp1